MAKGIGIALALLAVMPIALAISMNYECFGIGGGEDALAIEGHVGTYGSNYIGCFYPAEIIEGEGGAGAEGTHYFEEQQKRCLEIGGNWTGEKCVLDIEDIKKEMKKVMKKTNHLMFILLLSLAAFMIYRRRKIRKSRRGEQYGAPLRSREIRASEGMDTAGQEEKESP